MLADMQDLQPYFEPINRVKRYIREHLDEPLHRARLAAVAGFSVSHFHRIFTACVGVNVSGYVRWVRLERAARKLRMGAVDVSEVALAAGYKTHAAFGKAFKQQFDLSPSEFRQLGCRAATKILNSRCDTL